MQQEKVTKVPSKFLRLKICSYLPGYVLYHKIALLNKETRESLPNIGLFDQPIVITLKKQHDYSKLPLHDLIYLISLADFIQFQTCFDEIFQLTYLQIVIQKVATHLNAPTPTYDINFNLNCKNGTQIDLELAKRVVARQGIRLRQETYSYEPLNWFEEKKQVPESKEKYQPAQPPVVLVN